ncbi:importin subunit alpha-5-like [Drosophila elegans]|uniref:importin subunit alpha-5-like n=1 Tax=Drosophila elegans TaxID=30023 RepID=UPI0007E76E22|nr:importin subunit alpha-5-like [Drosophila elegans]
MSSTHKQLYKNDALSSIEMRRRREGDCIRLRKIKRQEQFLKRRIGLESCASNDLQTADMHIDGHPKITNELVQLLYSEHGSDQLNATKKLRKLLSDGPNPPIEEVVRKGLVPQLVSFLRSGSNAALQFEAAWTLTNIASGDSHQTWSLIEAGAVPILIELLSSSVQCPEVQEQAVWVLANIAGDSSMSRDHLLDCGLLVHLLQTLANTERISMIRKAVWTLSNLTRFKNPPVDFTKVVPCLPILARLLDFTDADALADTCRAIGHLLDGPNNQIQTVLDAGVGHRLVELLLHPQQNVSTAALKAVGNIATGEDQQIQVILDNNALPHISQLLSSPKEEIKEESCWTICNIAAGNREHIQAIINASLFPKLVNITQTAEFKTRKMAALVIANATSGGSSEQIKYLVEVGCVPPMCDFLTILDSDIILVALNALENILKAGEEHHSRPNPYALAIEECCGLDKIEYLQAHENRDIYQKSFDIIKLYFGSEEDDCRMAPVQLEFDAVMPINGFNF